MVSPETEELARRAEAFYEQNLRDRLEQTHRGWFVTIDPDSGDYCLGRTLREAALAVQAAHPNCRSFTIRIGYPVAFEIGNSPL